MYEQSLTLTGDIHIATDTDQLYDDLAGQMIRAAFEAVEDRKVFHLALSGGSTPEPFFIRLVIDPRFRAMPWQFTHIWFVDERKVPHDDDRSNFKMIRESLLDHIPIKKRQIHPMPVLDSDGPARYESEIRKHINEQPAVKLADTPPAPKFDFILLGMGSDTHTASLFPNSPALEESQKLVTTNDGQAVTPPPRMTMTYPLINAARFIAILVTGQSKYPALQKLDQQLQSRGPDRTQFPISAVDPVPSGGRLIWFLDPLAAGEQVELE